MDLGKVIFIFFVTMRVTLGSCFAFAEDAGDSDSLMPMSDASPSNDGFAVSLHKDKNAKIEIRPVQLIKPAQNSQFTPGVLDFNWALRSDVKRGKMTCVLENLDTKKVLTKDTRGDEMTFDLKPGNYRWRVVSGDSKIKSGWRTFEVIQSDFDISGRAPAMNIENLASKRDAPDLSHFEVPDNGDDGSKVDDDKKLKEYKHKKEMAEQEAGDLEKRVKLAELDARKALQLAKDEQARLKAVRLERARDERLAKERWAKLDADRKVKVKRDKLVREKKLKELHIAQLKVKEMNEKLQIKIWEAKKAKTDTDRATAELAAKIDAIKKSSVAAMSNSENPRVPTSQPEDDFTSNVQEE